MSKLAQKSGLVWLWLSLLLLVIDFASKTLVVGTMAYQESINLLPVFSITYVHNYGAAYSFLSEAGGWQRWFLSAIAVAISALLVWWLKRLPATNKVLCGAYALVLAGAIGNLYDRIAYGYVIDFIKTHIFLYSILPIALFVLAQHYCYLTPSPARVQRSIKHEPSCNW